MIAYYFRRRGFKAIGISALFCPRGLILDFSLAVQGVKGHCESRRLNPIGR